MEDSLDLPPKRIKIMADYGGAYAWDEDGGCIEIYDYFPQYPELKRIEDELKLWSDWFWAEAEQDDPDFPWDRFNKKGIRLAKEIAKVMKDADIKITYEKPFEDPDSRNSQEMSLKE